MKILFAIKALDNIQGGAERVLAEITSGLADKGHSVSILSFDQPGGCSFYPVHENVQRLSLGVGHAKNKTTIREMIARMLAIRRTVTKMQPSVVIAFMHSTFIPASFSLIGTGVQNSHTFRAGTKRLYRYPGYCETGRTELTEVLRTGINV